MQLIVLSKPFREKGVAELIELAHKHNFDGYDLAVWPGYQVTPDNAHEELVPTVKAMKREGVSIPMLNGDLGLLMPDDPTAEPILAAMDQADVRLIKVGYFKFDPKTQDYWQRVDKIRKAFEGWQELGKKHNVKICYHTHADSPGLGVVMGTNCASLMHMIDGFDPQYVGAYIDPGHLALAGESVPLGVAMVRKYLSIVSVKDVRLSRKEKDGHGARQVEWVPAGDGMVDWTEVFSELKRVGFDGPASIDCEFQVSEAEWSDTFAREILFFKQQVERMGSLPQ